MLFVFGFYDLGTKLQLNLQTVYDTKMFGIWCLVPGISPKGQIFNCPPSFPSFYFSQNISEHPK
jgi:hypothetical protein